MLLTITAFDVCAIFLIFAICIIFVITLGYISKEIETKRRLLEYEYRQLEAKVLKELNLENWDAVQYYDDTVIVKSRKSLDKYDGIVYFKDNRERLNKVERQIELKDEISESLKKFLATTDYIYHAQYSRLKGQIEILKNNAASYRINVKYITSAKNCLADKEIRINQKTIKRIHEDPSLIMSKSEYSRYLKDKRSNELNAKHGRYYDRINSIIEYANTNKDDLVIEGSQNRLDDLISKLYESTLNYIKRITKVESEEWNVIDSLILQIKNDVEKIVCINKQILDYYASPDFLKIKDTCEVLMESQREFNQYIIEKLQSISMLFGSRVVRNQTIHDDEFNYIRPYNKTVTPFTAELSKTVFGSAENDPLGYVIKNFYPDKEMYPKLIINLHRLVAELETLKEAKSIIENQKLEYKEHLGCVPDYVMKYDESGFYSRIGFANISENVLNVEYKFSYTSDGGKAQRTFTVPMTEDNIVELVKLLQKRLTLTDFTREQRAMMTKRLRDYIKDRDNFTCKVCGNSIYKEPNLLLEIDHIVPVSKGGCTEESNLQTLCWKCNRSKSDRI